MGRSVAVTHLSDQVGTFCVLALDRLEELGRARPGDGTEVLLELFLGHTDTRVCTQMKGTWISSLCSGVGANKAPKTQPSLRTSDDDPSTFCVGNDTHVQARCGSHDGRVGERDESDFFERIVRVRDCGGARQFRPQGFLARTTSGWNVRSSRTKTSRSL